jgi:hypothetical protein
MRLASQLRKLVMAEGKSAKPRHREERSDVAIHKPPTDQR